MDTFMMYLGILLLAALCVLDYTEGLAHCHVRRSTHCSPAAFNTTTYVCPARGHFPHPGNTLLYYRCPDVGVAACTCRCRYEGMCFHPHSRRCEFAFLPNIHHCVFPAKNHSEQTTIVPGGRSSSRKGRDGGGKEQSDMPGFLSDTEKMGRDGGGKAQSDMPAFVSDADKEKKDGGGKEHSDMPAFLSNTDKIRRLNERPQAQHQVAPRSFVARQTAMMSGVIKDKVPFPIWAVAIVALSLLIMLVLIIVLMY